MKQIHKRFIWASATVIMLSVIVAFSGAQDNGDIASEEAEMYLSDEEMLEDEESALLWDAVILAANKPDLRVHSITAPSSVSRGASIYVSDVTTNAGTANAGQSTSKIYIATNPNNVSSANLVASHNVSSIAKGKSWTWSGNVTVPSNQALGTNYYVVVANATRSVNELDYNNNTNYVMIIINP